MHAAEFRHRIADCASRAFNTQTAIDVDRTTALAAGFTHARWPESPGFPSGSLSDLALFLADPESGVSYIVSTQSPQYNFEALQNIETSLSWHHRAPWQMLANRGNSTRGVDGDRVSLTRSYRLDIFWSTQGRDLGGVARTPGHCGI